MRSTRIIPAVIACLLLGCGGREQSALHPAGPAASKIALLTWILVAAFGAVFLFVTALILVALFRKPRSESSPPPLGRTRFIVAGGVGLPVVVLIPLLVYSLETSSALRTPTQGPTVRVVGHMWWWEVHYPEHGIVTANELHIPTGERVRIELESADVVHSFWVPRLNGKRDMIPGIKNVTWIQADEPGVYRGQCAEYCGDQHAKMAFHVVALPPDEFRAWVSRAPAVANRTDVSGTRARPSGLHFGGVREVSRGPRRRRGGNPRPGPHARRQPAHARRRGAGE